MQYDYDIVFVTHLPAFYKVNLYRAIAQHCRVFVIFIAQSSQIRTADFTQDLTGLEHIILDAGNFENRSVIKNCIKLRACLKKIRYQKIVVGGWDLTEFWWVAFSSAKKQNALALESSFYESQLGRWHKWVKQGFLSRISLVYHSGQPHQILLQALGFKGELKATLGVGIFNYSSAFKSPSVSGDFQGKFLFVGRLAPEKNVGLLLSAFAKHPEWHLTIVGNGPLDAELKGCAPNNVSFLGYVSNEQLARVYQEHDVFVLPSLREPWGLVVEEALYHGLPIVASNTVGCAYDLVEKPQVGCLFDPTSLSGLTTALSEVASQYAVLRERVEAVSFKSRDEKQVAQYVETVS